MPRRHGLAPEFILVVAAWLAVVVSGVQAANTDVRWRTVANKQDILPNSPSGRYFNSFNQPSVNAAGVVVFRARSRGGPPEGEPTSGIYLRGIAADSAPILTVAGRGEPVPYPNNVVHSPATALTSFTEFPSIPRIGINSTAVATRGNHAPVWEYSLPDGSETRAGTTGVYVSLDPLGASPTLLTAASKLGAVGDFPFYAVPGLAQSTAFDVFPGAPAITDDASIVFKGNFEDGGAKTGVFYRRLTAVEMGGDANYIQLIASSDSPIPNPGSCPPGVNFGSTAPPSAALDKRAIARAIFVGVDNEQSPQCGGIYSAPLEPSPTLTTLVGLESMVPGQSAGTHFSRFGEGISYDGRFVAFWGAWGEDTKTLRLYCPQEGNQDRRDYCNNTGAYAGAGDSNSICDEAGSPCYQEVQVPVAQGIFVHDTATGTTVRVDGTEEPFDDFLYWVYSGKVPGSSGDDADDSEPPSWRASAFAAVSGRGASFRIAFKARRGEISTIDNTYREYVDGLYLARYPGKLKLITLLDTTTPGQVVDAAAAAGSLVTTLGLERDAFRGRWLAITASMGEDSDEEDAGMAGIYAAKLPW